MIGSNYEQEEMFERDSEHIRDLWREREFLFREMLQRTSKKNR